MHIQSKIQQTKLNPLLRTRNIVGVEQTKMLLFLLHFYSFPTLEKSWFLFGAWMCMWFYFLQKSIDHTLIHRNLSVFCTVFFSNFFYCCYSCKLSNTNSHSVFSVCVCDSEFDCNDYKIIHSKHSTHKPIISFIINSVNKIANIQPKN